MEPCAEPQGASKLARSAISPPPSALSPPPLQAMYALANIAAAGPPAKQLLLSLLRPTAATHSPNPSQLTRGAQRGSERACEQRTAATSNTHSAALALGAQRASQDASEQRLVEKQPNTDVASTSRQQHQELQELQQAQEHAGITNQEAEALVTSEQGMQQPFVQQQQQQQPSHASFPPHANPDTPLTAASTACGPQASLLLRCLQPCQAGRGACERLQVAALWCLINLTHPTRRGGGAAGVCPPLRLLLRSPDVLQCLEGLKGVPSLNVAVSEVVSGWVSEGGREGA